MNTSIFNPIVFSCSEFQEEIWSIINDIPKDLSPYDDVDGFISECAFQSANLPSALRRRLFDFRFGKNELGVLHLKKLPIDNTSTSTPITSTTRINKDSRISETMLSLIGGFFGDLISYRQEKNGEVFQNLHPVRGEEKRQSSESSQVRLEFHTETAFHPERCDFLLLYCIRPDHDKVAQTTFVSIHDVLSELQVDEINILGKPLFNNRIDYSFHKTDNLNAKGPLTPILFGYPEFPTWIFDEDMTDPTTDEAKNVLTHLHSIIHDSIKGVALDVGDLLIVDNYRVVHGRSSFTPKYDGRDRWLQRSFVARDIRNSAGVREANTRIVNRDFSSWIVEDRKDLFTGVTRPLD